MMTPAESKGLTLALRAALAYQAGDYAGVNSIVLGEDGGLAVEGLIVLLNKYARQAYGEDGWRTFLQQASVVLDAENILNEVNCHG